MKVKLRTRMAGPQGNFAPGTIVDVPKEIAEILLKTDQATALDDKPKRGRPAKVEKAELNPEAEKAINSE